MAMGMQTMIVMGLCGLYLMIDYFLIKKELEKRLETFEENLVRQRHKLLILQEHVDIAKILNNKFESETLTLELKEELKSLRMELEELKTSRKKRIRSEKIDTPVEIEIVPLADKKYNE